MKIIMTLLCVGFAAMILSCKDENPTGINGSPSDVVFPTDNVSYAHHVQPLFNQVCSMSGCHGAGEPDDRAKLNSYQNLMFGINGLPMVNPGSPETSELVLSIEGQTGQRMPLNFSPLNQNQINGIRAWIREGARDN